MVKLVISTIISTIFVLSCSDVSKRVSDYNNVPSLLTGIELDVPVVVYDNSTSNSSFLKNYPIMLLGQ